MRVHNSHVDAKMEIRRWALDRLAIPARDVRVLDGFAGPGVCRQAWLPCAELVGVDTDEASVAEIAGDLTFVLRSGAVGDLSRFNVVDLDPFANPWHALWILSRRQDARRRAYVLTDGDMAGTSNIKSLGARGWSWPMLRALGAEPTDLGTSGFNGARGMDRCVRAVVAAWMPWAVLESMAIATGGTQGSCIYAAFVLRPPQPGGSA